MSSARIQTLASKRLATLSSTRSVFPTAGSVQSTTLRSYNTNTSESKNDDGISPVYVHNVSKIVLQHLQDSRAQWLVEQGLDRGLHIKHNGTFLLRFPANGGRIWTSYDASTEEHWLSVNRMKTNAKFLLKQGSYKPCAGNSDNQDQVERQIKAAVDQMVRQFPPAKQQTISN